MLCTKEIIMIDYNNPEIKKFIIEYASSFDHDRNKRWVDVSHKFKPFNDFIIVTIQSLGKLDSRLIIEDKKLIETGKTSNLLGDLSEHNTQSYLWVLGAYEVLRSLAQSTNNRDSFIASYKERLVDIKRDFARIRIPLSKFEPAKDYSETDYCIAFPVIVAQKGSGWKTSENHWVSRSELSDKMLKLLEDINA